MAYLYKALSFQTKIRFTNLQFKLLINSSNSGAAAVKYIITLLSHGEVIKFHSCWSRFL